MAMRLFDYANKDGRNAHPGVHRLAHDTCASEKTVRRALAWLTEYGWIFRTKKGSRKLGEADIYQTTVPAPVAAALGWWTTERGVQWMERPPNEPRRPELQRDKTPFPEVNRDRYNAVLEVNHGVLEVNHGVLAVNRDLPPGLTTPGLTTPLRDSIAAPRTSARGGENIVFDEDDDVGDQVTALVETKVGGMLTSVTYELIDSMLARGAHPVAIVNAAVANERSR